MSRFFREQFLSEMYIRKLRKAGVVLISMTQEFQDDPTGNLIRQVLGSFDEYQSRENAKHTLRAMQENARQGFWNGSHPPYGYEAVAREKRGPKVKKAARRPRGRGCGGAPHLRLRLGSGGHAARREGYRRSSKRVRPQVSGQAVPYLQRPQDPHRNHVHGRPVNAGEKMHQRAGAKMHR